MALRGEMKLKARRFSFPGLDRDSLFMFLPTMGRWRHCVFDLSAHLCVLMYNLRRCVPGPARACSDSDRLVVDL